VSQIAAEAMPPADESSRDSLVVVQQAAKALTPVDPSLASTQRPTVDEPVPEPLMIPLAMVVLDELRERSSKVALTKQYEPVEALMFDRPHEAFSVRVRIGRSKRVRKHIEANARAGVQKVTASEQLMTCLRMEW
jgi:hypothetical protein